MRRDAPWWNYAVLALLPVLFTVLNRNWAFQDLQNYDAGYYFGDFIHFPRIHQLAPAYPHERILWIVPGYALVHLFGSVWGVFLLHCLTVWASLFLMHYILLQAADFRTAVLGAVMLGCSSSFLGPNGWSYPDGLLMVCLFTSVALLVRRPHASTPGSLALFFSGAAWCGLVSLYVLWVCLTPAYVFLMLRAFRGKKFCWPAVLRGIALSMSGAVAAGFALWGAYLAMGGRGFFLTATLRTARTLAREGFVQFLNKDWYREPVWLVLPALAVCVGAIGLVEYYRCRGCFTCVYRDLLWFYLICMAVMVVMTVRSTRILAFDYKTSILVPAVYLTFALVLFRVPETTPNWLFSLVGSLAVIVSLTPLARPGLYRIAYHREFLIPAFLLVAIVTCCRLRWPAHQVRWSAGITLFACASFGILASFHRPWLENYHGPEITERVSTAIRVILARTPKNAIPLMWYQNSAHLNLEFQDVMCAFMAGFASMTDFPKVDRRFLPGTRVFLLRDQDDAMAVASYMMARAGNPVTVKSRDHIEFGGESYWMTQFEVQPLSLAAVREGVEPIGQAVETIEFPVAPSGGAKSVRLASRSVSLDTAVIYQFELRYPRKFGKVKFGAVGENGAWIEESGTTVPDGEDDVVWFRMAVTTDEPVRLVAELTCTSQGCPDAVAGKLEVLRDVSGTSLKAFNLIRGLPYSDGNLLPGGSFNAGLTGWTTMKGAIRPGSNCHSGGCVEFTPDGTEMQYLVSWNAVKLKQGGSYELSAWIRSGTGKPLRLACGMWDVSRQRWVGQQSFTATRDWSNVKVRIQNDTEASLSPIFWQLLGDTGSMFVDEVELRPVAPLAKSGKSGSLIQNGGFENGLTGWDSLKGKIREGSNCHSGSCVEFLPLGTVMQYLVSWNAVTPAKGKVYELSAWIRSGTGKLLRLECGFWEQKRQQWVGQQLCTATPEWTMVKVRFQSDTNEKLSPIFWQSQGDFGSMFVDDVELKEIAPDNNTVSAGKGR